MSEHDQQAVRKEIRVGRSSLSSAYRQESARLAARQAIRQPWFLRARTIAAYIPAGGELDPLPILERALSLGKKCYLPVLRPFKQQKLWFAEWNTGSELVTNRFGIPEPEKLNNRLIAPWALDIVLMPLVAFDDRGHRIGMGGGYYDRTLAYTGYRKVWSKPLRVGYGYEFQRLTRINANPWDVPLDAIVTDRTIYTVRKTV